MQIPNQPSTTDWIGIVVACVSAVISLSAIFVAIYANRKSDTANEISRDSNVLSHESNQIAKRALELQESEDQVRLVIKPKLMLAIERGVTDQKPELVPLVQVINLSKFPVTIEKIYWKTSTTDSRGYVWLNPEVSNPYIQLPARLASHDSLTAVGKSTTFTLEELKSIVSAAASTSCGTEVVGMTDQWKQQVAELVKESKEVTEG